MGRLIFLGTASALPAADRGNTLLAVAPVAADEWLLIDCGGDPYRALVGAGIPPDGVRDLVITHAHIDHIGGLPSLIEGLRLGGRHNVPLHIWALPEVLEIARRLLDLFSYELTLDKWPFPVTLHAIEPGSALSLAGIPARTARMDHAISSVGVRLDLPGGPICYSCDTQPTPALPQLAHGVSLLITECTFLQQNVGFARMSKHLTAIEAGQQAAAAGARTLALVHLGVAEGWPAEQARIEAATAFGGRIFIPEDGEVIEV
jgi:ribonuclease Z